MKETINICFASDNNYAKYMGITIFSILHNAAYEDNINFYVLDNGISPLMKTQIESLKKIKSFAIKWIPVSGKIFYNCSTARYITIATYFRFLIPSLLPEVDKVLYLDCDLLVLADLRELFETDIGNYYAGGVFDIVALEKYMLKQFNLPSLEDSYVNCGVLLINNRKWRENDIQAKLVSYALNNSSRLHFADQDIINSVLYGKIKLLEHKWNVCNASYNKDSFLFSKHKKDILKALNKPAIRHYTGANKPWQHNCYYPSDMTEEYINYMKISPWKEDAPPPKNKFFYLKSFLLFWWIHPLFFLSPKRYKLFYYRGFLRGLR